MTGEIDRDFYCPEDRDTINDCIDREERCDLCDGRQRKWPTPEQYKQENQGREYPTGWAVYIRLEGRTGWLVDEYGKTKDGAYVYMHQRRKVSHVVCACTPWGRPPNNWRPE